MNEVSLICNTEDPVLEVKNNYNNSRVVWTGTALVTCWLVGRTEGVAIYSERVPSHVAGGVVVLGGVGEAKAVTAHHGLYT